MSPPKIRISLLLRGASWFMAAHVECGLVDFESLIIVTLSVSFITSILNFNKSRLSKLNGWGSNKFFWMNNWWTTPIANNKFSAFMADNFWLVLAISWSLNSKAKHSANCL